MGTYQSTAVCSTKCFKKGAVCGGCLEEETEVGEGRREEGQNRKNSY